jgi:hypothetical protein
MPDFERLHRKFAIYVAKRHNPDRIPILEAEFRGEDRARKEIVYVVGFLVIIVYILSFVIGRLL